MSNRQTRAQPPRTAATRARPAAQVHAARLPIVPFRLQWLFAAACLSAALLLHAPAARAGQSDIEAANNQLSAQAQRQFITYTETMNDVAGNETTLDSEYGGINGWAVSGTLMRDWWLGHDYFNFQAGSVSGQTSYTGGTLANPTYGSAVGVSGARVDDYLLRYGKGFEQDRESLLTLFVELGRRKYLRTLGLGTASAYEETYSHDYAGLGAMMQYSPMDAWVFSVNALLGHTFRSRITAVYPAASAQFSAGLGNSTLEKIGFQVDYAFNKHLHANASVDIASWSYGASAPQMVGGISLFEPNSTTSVTTAKIGLGYAF